MSTGARVQVRPVEPEDAPALAAVLRRNRDFLAPWDPVRPEEYFTEAGQAAAIETHRAAMAAGTAYAALVVLDGEPVGQVNVSGVVRGAFESANLGYWVAQEHNGRGVATAAVGTVAAVAFGELGLHRLQAGTLLHNGGSQRVLERNGFTRIGVAERYLRIAGRWQDHVLFQRLADDPLAAQPAVKPVA